MTLPVSSSLTAVSRQRFVEVIWAAIDRFVRRLRVERPSLHVQIREPRREASGTQLGSGAARDELSERVLRRVQDDLGHDLWRIHWRHGLRLNVKIGPCLLEEGGVDARWLHQRDG